MIAMTSPNVPNEEQIQNIEPDEDRVATREGDEGYKLNVYVIDSESVQETRAKTYTRAFGHYFVADDSEATEVLDQFFASFRSQYSVIDSFGRDMGEAYEVSVEVRENIQEADYVFRRSNAATIELPSHRELCDTVDEFLEALENDVQN